MAYSAGNDCQPIEASILSCAGDTRLSVGTEDIKRIVPGTALNGGLTTDNRQLTTPYVPGMMAVLMSPLRFSMCRNTCCKRESGASPVM